MEGSEDSEAVALVSKLVRVKVRANVMAKLMVMGMTTGLIPGSWSTWRSYLAAREKRRCKIVEKMGVSNHWQLAFGLNL